MATVLFHRNGQNRWSGLWLSDIEYYPDGESIESAYVVNGCWNLYIDEQDVMYSYATDWPRSRGCKYVASWKPDEVRIVQIDVRGDYNDVISAAEELL